MTPAAGAPFPWAVMLIAAPLLTGTLAFCWRRAGPALGGGTALLIPALAAGLLHQVLAAGPQRYALGGWTGELGPNLYADGLSVLMLAMTALVGALVTFSARGYYRQGESGTLFWPLWLLLWAALNALFLAADAFNLYVTLELLALSAVPLAALPGGPALGAALRYLLTSLLGSLCYLLGVGLLYAAFATVDLELLGRAMVPIPAAKVALALMTVGLLLKTALFPLHFWLPPAHANAPAPVSAALSALVVKASFYLLVRLWFQVFPGVAIPALANLLGALGAAAVLWGSLQACRQERLKLLVAYSTVAQLGYLFLLFPLAQGPTAYTAWSGAMLFAVSHAFGKSAMFLTAGSVMHAAGHDRLAGLAGLGRQLTMPLVVFALAAVGIIGLPPSGGFMAKWLLLNAALVQGQWWWVVVMAAGSLLAATYVIRVLVLAFRDEPNPTVCHPVPATMQWSALTLALLAFGLGLLAGYPVGLLEIGAPVGGAVLNWGHP
ncbi:NADH dehydrogenase [Desulfuromonas versatilis]|uniref:NADH dehydrogenase n=1 Tax=Desulfuromonas versatilis TaxID=2802975 RepID=A0ABN6DTX6_9BACT|nr:proton-conducting transporter membrane subunit [Desulfuromonas versatilis]BCR03578.1 NADH dehydrogenase [Desulfuromonas versatilis]